MGCDYETSEDYLQEVLLRLWRARENYQPTAKFTTYLFQIAKNYWLNELGKKKRRPATRNLHQFIDGHQEELADRGSSPDGKLLQSELQQVIQAAISQLPEKYRLVFVLSEMSDMKYQEIAEVLNIPLGTVKSRMFIAERKLRKTIQKYLKTGE